MLVNMTDIRTAAQMALEALTDERIGTWSYMEGSQIYDDFRKAADALRAALDAKEAMTYDTTAPDRAEVLRKLRETALERQKHLRFVADLLLSEAGAMTEVRIEAAAQLRQLAGE